MAAVHLAHAVGVQDRAPSSTDFVVGSNSQRADTGNVQSRHGCWLDSAAQAQPSCADGRLHCLAACHHNRPAQQQCRLAAVPYSCRNLPVLDEEVVIAPLLELGVELGVMTTAHLL